jgi:hypothetical protein
MDILSLLWVGNHNLFHLAPPEPPHSGKKSLVLESRQTSGVSLRMAYSSRARRFMEKTNHLPYAYETGCLWLPVFSLTVPSRR